MPHYSYFNLSSFHYVVCHALFILQHIRFLFCSNSKYNSTNSNGMNKRMGIEEISKKKRRIVPMEKLKYEINAPRSAYYCCFECVRVCVWVGLVNINRIYIIVVVFFSFFFLENIQAFVACVLKIGLVNKAIKRYEIGCCII